MSRHHATTIAIDGRAVLLFGASGSGKSDLALRLIDRGAVLVSDDQTIVACAGDRLVASAPATIAGLIEVRGIGIVAKPFLATAEVAMAVRLDEAVIRMPEMGQTTAIDGIAIPLLRVDPFEASAPIKVELALKRVVDEAR